MISLLKKPSAWIPIAIPAAFLAIMFYRIAMFGLPKPEADEGTLAHLFQLWLVFEPLMILFFAAKWLPQMPKQALVIIAFQIIASFAVIAPVFLLHL